MDLWYRKDRQAWYREQGPDAATDFYRRYKEDIALMQSINLQCFRTSLNWSRFLLDYENIVVDEEYAAYFDDMLDTCLAAGVEPLVCLEHYELPAELFTKYRGWSSAHVVELFVKYAEAAFERYGKKVKKWFVFNEPIVVQSRIYLDAERWPYEQDTQTWADWNHNKILATAKVKVLFNKFDFAAEGRRR